MKDLFSNPFSGVNAVQLDIDSILEYWCNPFMYDLYSGIKESDIFSEPMNIVFMGGRSTGKSMFLRYWSYPVQFRNAERLNKSLSENISSNGGVGLYFRIDGPILRSFQGKGIDDEKWANIFTHYFELIVAREYIEIINLLESCKEISKETLQEKFLPQVLQLMGIKEVLTIEELLIDLDERIAEVDTYRGNVAFSKEDFRPTQRGFSSQTLSFGISALMIETLEIFKDKNIILLLDEYENFVDYQQVVVNTLLRFSKPNVKFRLGMRLEGFRTYQMITDDDFIKETREYRKVVFEEVINKSKGYHDFLTEICKKRLEAIPLLKDKGFTDIKAILSEKEDFEQEALELAGGDHSKIYSHFKNRIPKDFTKQQQDLLKNKNPLLETLNYLWLIRGSSVDLISKSMNEYLNGEKTADAKKYKQDYVDKYKLSLLFLVASIYKKNKQYYSFNTFSFLSSGIVGHFIELCRRSFAIAGWGDNEKLYDDGIISKEHQSKAAREFSEAEKQQISRIETYGGTISKFVNNLGNVFREFHLDIKMRYPETNQFATNIDSILDSYTQGAMKAAIKWSVIQKKQGMQRSGPSERLQDTYTLNRIFSPIFQISFRTRGGKSISLFEKDITDFMNADKVDIGKFLNEEKISKKKEEINNGPNLFSGLE